MPDRDQRRRLAVQLAKAGCVSWVAGTAVFAAGYVLRGDLALFAAGLTLMVFGMTLVVSGLPVVWDRWCFVFRIGRGRVRHWHRPKWDIVNCARSREVAR